MSNNPFLKRDDFQEQRKDEKFFTLSSFTPESKPESKPATEPATELKPQQSVTGGALSLSPQGTLRLNSNVVTPASVVRDKPFRQTPTLTQRQSLPQTPPQTLPQTQQRTLPEMRSFGDIPATRKMIFDRVLNAASNLRPVENQRYSLTLGDVHYAEAEDPEPEEVKRAIMEGGSVSKTLRGTWTLTDRLQGGTTQRKTVIAKIPYLLDNGTFLRNGTKFVIRNQSRLLPGVYTKRKENGENAVHINADMREGAIHHYGLDQDTGQLNIIIGGSKTPIFAMAKALGATEDELKAAWGDDLYEVNRRKFSPAHIVKLHEKLVRVGNNNSNNNSNNNNKTAKSDTERLEDIRAAMERIRFDPDVMETTLGVPYDHLNKDVFLAATKKLIGVSRGETEPDDRDNMAFQEVWGPEDIFEERLSKDSGSFRRQLLSNLTYRYGGDVTKLPAGALTKQIDSAILGSGLGGNPEEINALEIFDKAYSLTKLGTGGLPSIDSVPDESRDVHPSYRGFIDPARTPESTRVGIDTYLASASRKGADRQLYTSVVDMSGESHWMRPKDLLRKTVAVASEYRKAADDDYIPVLRHGKEEMSRKADVDYLLPHFEQVFSPLANLVPFKSAAQGNRVAMGSRMLTQAMPLVNGEAPYVQTGFPGRPDWSYYKEFGKDAGAVFAEQQGTVLEATDKHVLVENADGTKKKIPLQRYMPSNRKTAVHQEPVVTVGQKISSGDLLVRSNMTDDKGQIAVGRNARVIMIPWKGLNFEDGMLISQSFADKMRSQHMYQHRIDWTPEHKQGKHSFMGIFPTTFDKRQLDQIDDYGLIKPGMVLKHGDPVVLAARSTDSGKKSKKANRRLFSDASLLWEHHDDGVVTDVYRSDKGAAVLVKMESGMKEGDKLANRYGNKSVVRILPDDEMPMTEDGMTADAAISPAGTVSRGNPAQVAELGLGKVAMLTGETYHVSDFDDIDDVTEFVNNELEKYGISPESAVIDRKTGKKIYNGDGSGIPNGSMWLMKLHHTSESKGSARGIGGYSSDDTPAKGGESGSKRMAPMHLNALVSHGAYNVFLDAKYSRGQANDEFWVQYMRGISPQMRKTPLVYEKFENSLKASGINVQPNENRLHVLAMTSHDVEELSGGREVKSGETLRWEKDKAPVMGGLFDPTVFGANGDRWGKLTPVVPILNPVMEEPARILLGLKQKEIKAVMSGKQDYRRYGSGFDAIAKALSDIDVPMAMNVYRNTMRHGTAAERDRAVRALGYLKASESTGVHPRDWMLSSVPVIPPKFRPVSEMQGGKVPLIDDANYLYKLMIDTNNSLKELRKYTKNTKEDEYGLYNTYQQVTGLADPSHPKLVQREVKGLLKHIFGVGSSKFSTVQRNLLGTPTDMVGRGVIVPDPDLGLDEVGIPEQKAWDTYRPHIIHRLTRRGVPWALASKMVEDQNPVAKDALLQEMGTRPVIVDRAPVLHKWGILAFKPKLVAGDAIRVNHFVNKGYNSDHDGNCCDYDTEIFIRLSKSNLQREDDPNKLQDEDKADAALHLFVSNLEESLMSISDEVSIDVFRRGKVIPVKIGLLPKLGIPVKDKNNADVHSIPKGVEVLSYDVNTGESGFAPISAYTVEHDVACVRVTTSGGRSVVVSDNESLAAYNHETGCLEKITPAKCQGRLVPVVKQRGYSGNKYSRSLGWFYGALISDGWVTARTVGYAKVDESKRRFFESVARTEIEPNFISRTYKESAKGRKNKLADSVKIHLNGRDLATKIFKCVADPTGQEEGGRAALRKYIPRELLYGGSRECWLGLLAGLLEGDGTMTWNYTYKKKRAVIRFSTSSERLVADIRDLGSRLGFGMSVTVTPPRGFSHTAYSVCLSIPDMWNLFGELEFVSESAKQFQKDFLAVPMSCNMRDIVPVMESEAEYVTQLLPADRGTPVSIKAARGAFSRAKITGYFSRDVVKQYLQYVPDDSCPELRKHVAATDITWEVYETVEPVESRDVFDISVEGTKVFVVGTGLVVFDTMNFHVPMSEDAVKEAYELLLPSKSLIQARDMKSAQPRIISEGLGGLFLATLPPDKKQKPRTFVSWADAEKAYRSGNLAIDDPVVVLSSKPLPRR